MRDIFCVAIRFRKRFVFLATALFLLALVGLSLLRFDDSYRGLFASSHPEFKTYEQLAQEFGSDENDLLILLESESVLDRQMVNAVSHIHGEIDSIEEVDSVLSILSLRDKRRVGKYFLPVLQSGMSDEKLDAALDKLISHPFGPGHLLSDDRSATLLIVRLSNETESVHQIEAILSRLDEIVKNATQDAPVRVGVTGLPALRVEIVRGVQRDQVVLTVLAFVLASITAWFLFRSLATIAVVCVAPVVGTIWTLGVMGLVGEPVNAMNTVVPTLLVVIGFTDSVHLLFDIRRHLDQGQSPLAATRSALRVVGPACLLTSLTTAAGFASLVVVEDQMIRRFGITCASGTIVMMFAVLMIVPLIVSSRIGKYCSSPKRNQGRSWEKVISHRLVEFVLSYSRSIASAAIIATVTLVFFASYLSPDFRYSENLPNSNAAAATLKRCDALFHGASTVQAVLQVPESERLIGSDSFEALQFVHRQLEAISTGKAVSLRTLVESLPGKTTAAKMGELRYLPREAITSFVHAEQRKLIVRVRVEDIGSAALLPKLQSLRNRLAAIRTEHQGYDVHISGVPVLSTYRSQPMIRDLVRSLMTATIIVFVLFAIAYRSLRIAIVSLVPNLFPLVATATCFVAFDQPLRYSAVVCFSICLGIAVDDTVHFISRYRSIAECTNDRADAIRKTFVLICPVLLVTTILMCVGFAATLLSTIPTIRLFGGTTILALLFAVFADLVFLPALLSVLPAFHCCESIDD